MNLHNRLLPVLWMCTTIFAWATQSLMDCGGRSQVVVFGGAYRFSVLCAHFWQKNPSILKWFSTILTVTHMISCKHWTGKCVQEIGSLHLQSFLAGWRHQMSAKHSTARSLYLPVCFFQVQRQCWPARSTSNESLSVKLFSNQTLLSTFTFLNSSVIFSANVPKNTPSRTRATFPMATASRSGTVHSMSLMGSIASSPRFSKR